ncbi:MAG TPA: rhodanese-related sulfurtransferase [Leptospiraceae bacterium]|nr:rhodanese-related sulfurtransferase [Leptospiraceae bacterium]HMW05329.1 rhodanese-related sulfurtransferase [Leptospiraceae bacterium]HMX32914.1 rhodanese-related sulfurtransferase [Leptospiraceae bacterium]HMY31525.1 rhodanese-related sulfurtransferase [Leptospiraceae bacterium]HMZ67393.1 rhodanese-related sulfurtransferase [Leptospiraceae bacterium]
MKEEIISKDELRKRLQEENFKRVTLSFYRYTKIENPNELRLQLLSEWGNLNVFGRIYLAKEGVNAQLSVPEFNFEKFKAQLNSLEYSKNMPLKIAIEDDGKSFFKLTIKVKEKIVADGLDDSSFDPSNVGKHLTAQEFNKALEDPNTVVVDVRNHYESEIGHFEKAICPDADTFREELPMIVDLLQDKKDKKILLYCTGGIRCEKASAYLKHKGFLDVNQLLGGIISYAREVKELGLESKFKGKNFVFDERLGERISEEVISHCHQCGKKSDRHVNCKNDACHLLFIQCEECSKEYEGCCSIECRDVSRLPEEEQIRLRKEKAKSGELLEHKSRLRPRLKIHK